MLPGTGIWIRIYEGAVVTQEAFDNASMSQRSRMKFVPVPRASWLQDDGKYVEHMLAISTIDRDEQVASFSLQGRAIERSEVQQPDFKVKAEQLTLNLFPAEVSATAGEDFGRQVLPLSTDHLMQIFGACVLPDEYLTSWNDQIQEVVQRVRLASLGVLLCSQREQEELCQQGLISPLLVQPPVMDALESADEEDVWEGLPMMRSAAPVVQPRTFVALTLLMSVAVVAVAILIHAMAEEGPEKDLAG